MIIEEGQSTYRKAIECVYKFQEHVEKAHTNKIPTDKTNRANIRRQTQEHKSSINERYQNKKKEQKPNTHATDRRVEIRARGHGHAAGVRILLGTRA